MSERVIEVITECEHGNSGICTEVTRVEQLLNGGAIETRNCPGGSRVRYTRQEAIDQIWMTNPSPWSASDLETVQAAVDALLGDNQ